MRRIAPVLMIVCLLVGGRQATAEMCTIDVVPAATLLLPYFEVDVADPLGKNTIFWINNAFPDPALVHLIMWSNWAAPLIDFDVFLTGYDVVPVDLYDMIVNGNIPITADEQSDPDDTISPHGMSQWDGSFPNCLNFFPWFVNPAIQGTAYDRLHNGSLGRPVTSLGGDCLGQDFGDDVARGYVTVDSTSECSLFLDPGEVGYFQDGGLGVANDNNQLWGDYFIIDPANSSMSVQPLVHVEADPAFDGLPTDYTFYGRYLGADGRDDREPLGTAWGVRYLNGGEYTGSEFVVWRDPTSSNVLPAGATCGVGPDWYPLPETEVVCFDEEENFAGACYGDPPCFPLATQKVRSDAGNLAVPFTFGWCHLNLNVANDAPTGDVDFPVIPPGNLAQSYVGAVHNASGLYSGGLQAVELASACRDPDPLVGLVFADGFESGDTSAWSSTTP